MLDCSILGVVKHVWSKLVLTTTSRKLLLTCAAVLLATHLLTIHVISAMAWAIVTAAAVGSYTLANALSKRR